MNNNVKAIAETKSGKLEGYSKDGLYIFKGIPYAAPPVGNLRWMPPQAVKPWSGVRSAKEYGAIAPQTVMPAPPGMPVQPPQKQSEDCLFLNIWTPGLDNGKRPVMIWIHGGAFVLGSGSDPMYEGGKLPKNGNVVLVTINYRLSMLGFLRLKDATGAKIPSTGNEGLLDQAAAIRWVKENIEAFGGDSNNITVFGESAGSMSISCLLIMPAAKKLFRKAILESGASNVVVPKEAGNSGGRALLEAAGLKQTNAEELMKMSLQQLLDIETKMKMASPIPGEPARITITMPVADGEVIPESPLELARKGAAKDIITVIGSNLDEWTLFGMMQPGFNTMTEEEMMKTAEAMIPGGAAGKIVEAYRSALRKRGANVTPTSIMTAIQTDNMFRMPAVRLVEAQQKNNAPSYNYLFDWKSPLMGGIMGACHALEIGFVFGTHEPMFNGSGPDADKLSESIQEAWIAFARTGNPSCKSMGDWPQYEKKRMTMIIGKNNHVEAAPYEEERAAWDLVK